MSKVVILKKGLLQWPALSTKLQRQLLHVYVCYLFSGGVDGLVRISTDGVHKLTIDEGLMRVVDLSVVSMHHSLKRKTLQKVSNTPNLVIS